MQLRTWYLTGLAVFILCWSIGFARVMSAPPDATLKEGDAFSYNALAVNLVQSHMYSLDGVHPSIEREPGYSFFLAGIYEIFGVENRAAVFMVTAILYALAAWLFSREVGLLTNQRTGILCFFLLATCASVFHALFILYREAFTFMLLMLAATLFLRCQRKASTWSAAGIGALLGGVALSYLPLLPLPLIFAGLAWYVRIGWKRWLPMLIIPALLVSLWVARNAVIFGRPALSGSHRTAVVWYVRGEQAERVTGTEPFMCLWAEYISRDWSHRSDACSFNALMHARWPQDDSLGAAEDARIAAAGRQKILSHFGNYLWFSVFEILELHLPYVGGGFSHIYNLLAVLCSVVLYIGCVFGIGRIWSKKYALLLLLIGFNTFVFIVTDATPRYLIPVIFCYAVIGAVGYDRLLGNSKNQRPKSK